MSGIVGVLNRDRAPVDRDVLQRMTHAMIRRGPDAQHIWVNGSVGLGHAALFTTLEAERENQPTTLDGQVWITADARIDEWDHLRSMLSAKGRQIPDTVTDVELILHAYHVWGEDCVDHLIGDFSFAIWDARQQKLFCARDHMGVKPFYYFLSDKLFIFASDVGALLAMPEVPRRLNEARIADFHRPNAWL
jgi:asparagine synthase (glutamine-hydrolysing)